MLTHTDTDTDISVPGIGIGMNTRYRSNPISNPWSDIGSVDLIGDFRRRKSPLFGDFQRRKSLEAFLAHSGA